MIERYNQFYKWWVHPKIQGDVDYDQICWAFFNAHFQLILNYTFLYALYSYFDYPYGIYACVFGIFASITKILALRFSSNFPLIFHLSLAEFILLIFCISYGDGGIWSYYNITYIGIIWWGFYFNKRVGIWVTVLLGIWILFWTWMEYNGFTFPQEFPEEFSNIYRTLYLTMVLAFYILIFWMASLNEQRIRKKLVKTQDRIERQEKMVSLGKLTAGIAHEINNPINFIQGNTIAMEKDLNDLEPVFTLIDKVKDLDNLPSGLAKKIKGINLEDIRESAEEMSDLLGGTQRGSQRISKIVEGLKNFSYQSGKGFKKIQISEIIQSALAILNNRVKKKEISLACDFNSLPEVYCEVSKISQVFINIIDNAIEAVSEKGQISIQTFQKRSSIIIKIKDNGVGMDGETQKHLFDPFFTTKEVGKGTGLGMSISYGIIRDHRGTIEVESKIDIGTIIKITLPV